MARLFNSVNDVSVKPGGVIGKQTAVYMLVNYL
jgi:hypothetical protein